MYVYAAYNSAPADLASRTGDERTWYELLAAEALIGGLELSFNGALPRGERMHPLGVAHLATLLDPRWSNVVSNIAGTLAASARDPLYGLASTSAESRARAVDDVRALFDSVAALQDALGTDCVRAVELHSAPRAEPGASSIGHLADSLAEIAALDWNRVQLVVEHADALIPGQEAAKGYLDLASETVAARSASADSGRRIGQSINWGRSAIESRSAEGAAEQVRQLARAGTLLGLMFSGTSGAPTGRSTPWQDVHLALDELEPQSLLTRAAMAEALAAAAAGAGATADGGAGAALAGFAFVGVKVGALVGAATLRQRLEGGLQALHALDSEVAQLAGRTPRL